MKQVVKVALQQKVTKVDKAVQDINVKMAHEGGQMPIQRRIPKRGFININRIEYRVLNIGQIDTLTEKYGFTELIPKTCTSTV